MKIRDGQLRDQNGWLEVVKSSEMKKLTMASWLHVERSSEIAAKNSVVGRHKEL